jgi:hypothetical protein
LESFVDVPVRQLVSLPRGVLIWELLLYLLVGEAVELAGVDLVQRLPAQLGEGQVARRLDRALQRRRPNANLPEGSGPQAHTRIHKNKRQRTSKPKQINTYTFYNLNVGQTYTPKQQSIHQSPFSCLGKVLV